MELFNRRERTAHHRSPMKPEQKRNGRETEQLPTIQIVREHDSVEDYVEEIKARGYLIEMDAKDMLANMTLQKTDKKNLTLIEITPRDLGLTGEMRSVKEIFQAAKERGLEVCPPWVALQYRLDCDSNRLTAIGMEPIITHGGHKIFDIHDKWLDSIGMSGRYHPDRGWLFVLPG